MINDRKIPVNMNEVGIMEDNQIAILSFHNADNYGAVLQNYALQTAISCLGYTPVTIDYHSPKIESVYDVNLLSDNKDGLARIIKGTIINIINHKKAKLHQESFKKFRCQKLTCSMPVDTNSIAQLNDAYKVYICGSDQIWNKGIIAEEDRDVYTLNFVKRGKKVSYAASAGSSVNLTEDIVERIAGLDKITVRETELAAYLAESLHRDVQVACDPVFLMSKNEWFKCAEREIESENKKRYLLLYHIDKGLETCDIAKDIAKDRKLIIRYPIKKNKKNLFWGKCVYDEGPLEFVADIANAEMIVASSFHAVAFSIIFEKEFVTVLHEETGSRVANLLETLGLQERIVKDLEDYKRKSKTWKPINYSAVKEKLDIMRENSYKILYELCSNT